MERICLETQVDAPPERCFDLSRSVDLHVASMGEAQERAVAGVTSGLMKLGDVVTWEARHFGLRQRLTVRIDGFERPAFFSDSQVRGIFKEFQHVHRFIPLGAGTMMKDVFEFTAPFGVFGRLAEPVVARHLRGLLQARNQAIKSIAESDEWKRYL